MAAGMKEQQPRTAAEALLEDLGFQPRLTVFLGSAPGAGKTRRILEEARALRNAGTRVVIGRIETKQRPELNEMAAEFPQIPPRTVTIAGTQFEDFDLQAALDMHPAVVILDELAHSNLAGSINPKRWQDALALREAGISVLTAFNIQHLETVAPVAEQIIGFPVREIIPATFLKSADQVIGIDVAPEVIESRLQSGQIVPENDIDRALTGVFRRQTLSMLRELMLRTLDDLTVPVEIAGKTSTALALVTPGVEVPTFLRKAAALSEALDLSLEVATLGGPDAENLERSIRANDARRIDVPAFDPAKANLNATNATLVALARGELGSRIASHALDRDIFIADPGPYHDVAAPFIHQAAFGAAAGDRFRIGHGRLTVYLGAAAGSGKTYAMLDRAHQLMSEGVDVVAAFVETHGRPDTEAKLQGLEVLPRKTIVSEGVTYTELDVDALLARHPTIALIDELAHTNAPGSAVPKRYESVLTVLRAGISVLTTLNIQHLEGLNDVVARLTGIVVRETLPDKILDLADDVILIDVTPQTLRERLRAGKIYKQDKIEAALSNFFRTENLAALRDLAIREARRARSVRRPPPFSRLLLGVAGRLRDTNLIRRSARLASRLEIDLSVAHVATDARKNETEIVESLARATRVANAQWIFAIEKDPAKALVRIAKEEQASTIVVEGLRKERRWFGKAPFAKALLEAGAPEILILSPVPEA
jgi:two-component system sensor histidine kinase KdpD